MDGDPFGIGGTGKLRRIGPIGNEWDLGRGEGDHPVRRVLPEVSVEIMKIPSSGPEDNDLNRTLSETPAFRFFPDPSLFHRTTRVPLTPLESFWPIDRLPLIEYASYS